MVLQLLFCLSTGPQNHEILKSDRNGRRASLHSFPTLNPNLRVEPVSDDPNSDNFMAFHIIDTKKKKEREVSRFRADNIVHMRMFMASLGGSSTGLFSPKGDIPVEASLGLWDTSHLVEEGTDDQEDIGNLPEESNNGQDMNLQQNELSPPLSNIPTNYQEALQLLPFEFYFQKDTGLIIPETFRTQLLFPGRIIPKYDPKAPLPKASRRPWHDTFRHPLGPRVFLPISIGYGSEVGLEPGIQELWDPTRRTNFFVDHNKQAMFLRDPRKPKEVCPVVKQQVVEYGDRRRQQTLPPGICTHSAVIEATSKRAYLKPYGCIVRACGIRGNNGNPGNTGLTGQQGISGKNGGFLNLNPSKHGKHGQDGGPGGDGMVGFRGVDGTDASDMIISIAGDANELRVSGCCTTKAHLGGKKGEQILFINCRGGDGGHGGRGGNGGEGGNGGNGGNGSNASSAYAVDADGEDGGNGGDGGDGGKGGDGGNGGNGGNAGCGGRCVIQTNEPTLLMLVEADCMSGTPGKGANGGKGVVGGTGGNGGRGGSGGPGSTSTSITCCTAGGLSGRPGYGGNCGRRGHNGRDGRPGQDGAPAKHGGILWVLFSKENGSVLQEASTRYDAEVTGFNVKSASIHDGIFEPNEQIVISSLSIINSGGLLLPEGASAFFPSTQSIKFEPTVFDLPSKSLFPTNSFTVPITYRGRIADQPPPNVPGPFVSAVEFCPRIELIGRPFEKSFLRRKLVVQYPVKLAYLRCSENLGRGEVSVLNIGIQNISNMPYGNCPGTGGKVVLQIHFDSRIIPVGSANVSQSKVPYTITYDPEIRDSMFIQVDMLPPHVTSNIQVTIQMENRAELFNHCSWQADLYLRDKLIEYNLAEIRVSPFYIPRDPPADVLFITNELITRKEFVFWQKLLEYLEVSVDFWDTAKYGGLSVDCKTNARHEVTWEGRYQGRMILYPHCNLQLLHSTDIVRHFSRANREDQVKDLHSSMILFMPPDPNASDVIDEKILKYLTAAERAVELPVNAHYGGRHISKPGSGSNPQPYLKWEKKYIKKLEKERPAQLPIVVGRQTDVQSTGLFKYSYGTVDIRRVPLLHSAKFLVITSSVGNAVNISDDDTDLSPNSPEIPLASNYGQVFLATLFGISMRCKLELLKTHEEVSTMSSAQFSFLLPNGAHLSKAELVMITTAWEIADEVYNFTGFSQRMRILTQDIRSDTAAYIKNGRIILRGLVLIKKEVMKRKKNLKKLSKSQVSQAQNEISRLSNQVGRALRQAGVDNKDLDVLISLNILTDSDRFHRTHQLIYKDKKWDLTG